MNQLRAMIGKNRYLSLVMLMVALSGFVAIEPAPYDVMWALLALVGLLLGYVSLTKVLTVPILSALIFLGANLISMTQADNMGRAVLYVAITIYLVLSWLFFSGLLTAFGKRGVDAILSGYVAAGVIASLLGILGQVNLIPYADLFVYTGVRAQGFFKDPNVFGPFLVPITLYGIMRAVRTQGRTRWLWIALSGLTGAGVVLSLSRGAWVNLAVSGLVYLFLRDGVPLKRKITVGLTAVLAIGLICIYPLSNPQIGRVFVSRFGLQRYDQDRFSTQAKALHFAVPAAVEAEEPTPRTEVATPVNPTDAAPSGGTSTRKPSKIPTTPDHVPANRTPPDDNRHTDPTPSEPSPASQPTPPGQDQAPPGAPQVPPVSPEASQPTLSGQNQAPPGAPQVPLVSQEEPPTTPNQAPSDDTKPLSDQPRRPYLGIGPGQTEPLFNYASHNLFLRVLVENGYLGLFGLALILLTTLTRALWGIRTLPLSFRAYHALVAASLIGILVNSLVIDSLHWRHLWLLLALPWLSGEASGDTTQTGV